MITEIRGNYFFKITIINSITFLRLIAVLILFNYPIAFIILALSFGVGISDYLDGYLARLWKCETNFGKNLDQWVDKVVAIAFLLFYYQIQAISLWFIILFVLREIFVVVGRSFKLIEGSSNSYGKIKTFLFYIFIIFISYKNYNPSLHSNAYPAMVLLGESLILFYSYFAVISSVQKNLKDKLVYFIGSSFFTAYVIKKMPGTISSLAAFLILYYFSEIAIEIKLVITLIFILIHFFTYPLFEKLYQKEDISFYTIDEVIAVLLFWMLPLHGLKLWVLVFILFRCFDIFKPLGIKKVETTTYLTKSMRIIADDLMAMLYTLIIIYAIKQYI